MYHGIPLGQIGRTIDAEGPFIRDYWHDWSPDLPSYQAFCRRLNNLAPAFQALAEDLAREHGLRIVTPRKRLPGDTLLSGDAYSTAVSTHRQSIKSLVSAALLAFIFNS